MIRLMTVSLDLSLASLQALAPMFSSRLSITTQTEVHTFLHALLISQKLLIKLITGYYNKLLDDNVNSKIVRILAALYST